MTGPPVGPRPRAIVVPAGRGLPGLKGGGSAVASGIDPGPDTVRLDPFLFPPPFATTINLAANQATNGANDRQFPAALSTAIPENCYGVISSISLMLDSILITSNVQWTILINGIAVPGFTLTILGRNGAASVSSSWPGPLRILIPLGGRVGVQILNVDGGNYTAGTQLYGWFFPQKR